MNVICEKCNKRYAIADDKVRGKSVKIRCKQCQNLISVQGPGVPAASGVAIEATTTGSHQAALAVADHAAVWFAMVKGNQIGPLDLKQLETKVKSGDVSARTYLWKQGMADWKRAVDVPEVSSVFAGVSAGATATGPTRSVTTPSSAAKKAAAIKSDIALSNEVPSPSAPLPASPKVAAPRMSAPRPVLKHPVVEEAFDEKEDKTVAADPELMRKALAAAAQAKSGSQPAVEVEVDPASDATVKPAAQPTADPKALAELSDSLFNDPSLAPSSEHPVSGAEEESPSAEAAATADGDKADPFASMGEIDPKQLPPPGEATRFFINQAGVNKRNPPWKIALFIVSMIGLPVGFTYLLSSLKVIPKVTVTTEDGREVQQDFFSPGGLSSLKDMLTGEAEQKRLAAEAKRRAAEERRKNDAARAIAAAAAAARPEQADLATGKTGSTGGTGLTQAELQQLYGKSTIGENVQLEKKDKGPINRVETEKRAMASGDGLSDDAAGKVIAQSLPAFNNCIEQALRRNPNMKVGRVKLVVTVGPSGTVTQSTFSSVAYDQSEWGVCVKAAAKRMRFPPFEGDPTDVEVPLIVGVAL
ncbi:MAG: zinc-ribbon domain-containing protein [Myxococcaceae bacterium]|nr:zinc-ribbon domain-containing protein [Myxococcaceae bacterium]